MPNKEKIQPKDYYDFLPPNLQRTGDIWRGLPTFSMLGKKTTTGIVLTPACDLANKKCETITYCPIVSILQYVNSPSFYSDLWREISEVLTKLKLQSTVITPSRFELPLLEEIQAAQDAAGRAMADDEPRRAFVSRLEAYSKYIDNCIDRKYTSLNNIATVFAKGRFEAIMRRVVTNAYSADTHFLPSDGKTIDNSAIAAHSLVLFRYVLTVPIEVLDMAQLSTSDSWWAQRTKLQRSHPIAELFSDWPIRLATLKDDFLSDLLSRYVSMQIRLGSRDFTDGSVDQFVSQLRT